MFNFVNGIKRKVAKWADALVSVVSGDRFTKKELELPADAFEVKRKLGPSFFTRRLSPRVRARRIALLTNAERRLARERGWVGPSRKRKVRRLVTYNPKGGIEVVIQ